MRYFLGLDNGGTKTKASIYDENGKEIITVGADTPVLTLVPDFAERDMDEMWDTCCSVVRQAVEKTGIPKEQIIAAAVCGHGKGLYLWGKDGRPVRNGILSADRRAFGEVETWKTEGVEQRIFPLNCQHLLPGQPAALISWLEKHEPGTLDKTKWIFACKDYIRFRMTGSARAEITDNSGSGFLNLNTCRWDDRILGELGLNEIREKLPPLCGSVEPAGFLSREAADACGLREGMIVAGGMFDIDACAAALNMVDTSRVCMIAGTWSVNEFIAPKPVMDGAVMMNSVYCMPGYYLVEECSPTSAGNLEWFIRNIFNERDAQLKAGGESFYDEINECVRGVDPETFCPVFLPFISASNVNPNARGCFVGVDASQGRGHMLRGIYEGITFSHRFHFEKLLKASSGGWEAIRLAGGASHSSVWAQMFADVMQIPVETMEAAETGTLGCAMAAAVAAGVYPSMEAASGVMSRVCKIYRPDADRREIYDRKYRAYLQVIRALDPAWDELRNLWEG